MHSCGNSSVLAMELLQICTKPLLLSLEGNFVKIHLTDW